MTLQELAIVLLRDQNEAQDDASHIAVVVEQIKDALEEISVETNWRWLIENDAILTVGNQETYTLEPSIREVRAIKLRDSNEELQYIAPERLIGRSFDLESTGTPRFWWYDEPIAVDDDFSSVIRLWPTPSGAIQLDAFYTKNLRKLTGSSQLPIPDDFVLLLKDRVRAYILEDDKDYDGADRAYQRFAVRLNRLRARENSKYSNYLKLQPRDISSRGRWLARLDPNHF